MKHSADGCMARNGRSSSVRVCFKENNVGGEFLQATHEFRNFWRSQSPISDLSFCKVHGILCFFQWWIFPSQNPLNDNTGCYYRGMGLKKEKRLPGNMVISIFMTQRERYWMKNDMLGCLLCSCMFLGKLNNFININLLIILYAWLHNCIFSLNVSKVYW